MSADPASHDDRRAEAADRLLQLLTIERLERDLFRGRDLPDEGTTRIFGGLVIAQALLAAFGTVENRLCHSLHAYFLRPGDPAQPVIYQVDRARDGGSFTTRRVVAIQHGAQIFHLSASFHVEEESWTHQHPMPDIPAADRLEERREQRARAAAKMPDRRFPELLRDWAIDMREVDPRDLFAPEPASDRNNLWFRVPAAREQGDAMRQALLAYASDMSLLGAALRPHGLSWFQGKVMSASLDHAMWFHGPVALEDWHLYAMDSPFAGKGRGFNRGAIYDAKGRLVASVAQEGLMRPRRRD